MADKIINGIKVVDGKAIIDHSSGLSNTPTKLSEFIDDRTLVVRFTPGEDDYSIISDKTYDEIDVAIAENRPVIGVFESVIYRPITVGDSYNAPSNTRGLVSRGIVFNTVEIQLDGYMYSSSITVSPDGAIFDSIDGRVSLHPNWNETNNWSPSYIANKPTKLSQFENDLYYYKEEEGVTVTASDFTELTQAASTFAVGSADMYYSNQPSLDWITSIDDFTISATITDPDSGEVTTLTTDDFIINDISDEFGEGPVQCAYEVALKAAALPATYGAMRDYYPLFDIIVGASVESDETGAQQVVESDGGCLIAYEPENIQAFSSISINKVIRKEIPLNCIEKFTTVGKITEEGGEIFNTASFAAERAHAEGTETYANGISAHAEGSSTNANGFASHAEGGNAISGGSFSHAEGWATVASSDYQHAQGKYNVEDTEGKYAHIVGNGGWDGSQFAYVRSNAHTLDWSGNAEFAGDVVAYGCGGENPIKLSELAEFVNTKSDWNATDEDIMDMMAELGIVSPVTTSDGAILTSADGVIYSL